MKYGFIKTACVSPAVRVADVEQNLRSACEALDRADAEGVHLLVYPELFLTAYTCQDLFFSDLLLARGEQALLEFAEHTKGKLPVAVLGLPIRSGCKLYNCAAAVRDGTVLGLVPKSYLPNYGEFYEKRQFSSGLDASCPDHILLGGLEIPFGTDLLFQSRELTDFVLGVELCEDLWAPVTPSTRLCLGGATVIANPSASDELIGKEDYRRLLVSSASSRLICGYVYSNAGPGESTQDLVFSAHCLICENGAVLAEQRPFDSEGDLLITELDLFKLRHERHFNTSFEPDGRSLRRIFFSQPVTVTSLTHTMVRHPFVPADGKILSERAEQILRIQSYGLKKRLEHTRSRCVVLGISGGLDSTLALLAAVRSMDLLGRSRKDILAVTMPCFGTTSRTRGNAETLCEELGVSFRTVDITSSVLQHFKDIGQEETQLDVTYENCQARERTQVLMDLANKENGLVLGTGDLSELALGWATYNGDHMSMYGINASVPKTLVRYIVAYEASRCDGALKTVLEDILDTPVSPELLPASADGTIAQKTEDLVGPYELHDFFLYHMLRTGSSPARIFHLACYAFSDAFPDDIIKYWLKVFVRRFFAMQFKRSCLPDGPKVGTVTLSPRGDWRMPSDACSALWLSECEQL